MDERTSDALNISKSAVLEWALRAFESVEPPTALDRYTGGALLSVAGPT